MKKQFNLGVAAMVSVACSTSHQFRVSQSSVEPGSSIDWLGNITDLKGSGSIKIGQVFPEIKMVGAKMNDETLEANGKVIIISVIPSIDTEVCEVQTHLMNDLDVNAGKIDLVTVSKDLPYAQSRFAEQSKMTKTRYLSDFRYGEFGQRLGLEISRNGLLARALIVIDGKGVVQFLQITPEIYTLPDLNAAYKKARSLLVD